MDDCTSTPSPESVQSERERRRQEDKEGWVQLVQEWRKANPELANKPRPTKGRKPPSGSYLYFLQAATGQIKIGSTANPRHRLSQMRSFSPVELSIVALIPGKSDDEGMYHERFAAHRAHGEWFAPHADILAEITRLNQEQPA